MITDEDQLVAEVEATQFIAEHAAIGTPAEYQHAADDVLLLDNLIRKIKDYWKGPKEAAYKAHKAITAKETEMLKPVEAQRKSITGKISLYLTEQDRLRREEERRQREEQHRKEEAERQRLLDEAAAKEAEGKKDEAEQILSEAENVPTEVLAPPPSPVQQTLRTETGVASQRRDIELRVIDPMAILKAVIDGKLPPTMVTINEGKLKTYAKNLELTEIPGCSIKPKIIGAFRSDR